MGNHDSLHERIFEATSDALFVADAETREVLAANPAAATLVGRDREGVVGSHVSTFHPEDDQARYERLFEAVLEAESGVREDVEVVTAAGERVPVELSAVVIDSGDGRLVQGTFRDISERKRLERRLRAERERYRQIFTQSNDAIFILDPERDEILECNEGACTMLGYDHGDLVGMPVSEIHPDEMDTFREFAADVIETGEGWTDELTCLTRNGKELPAVLAASTIEWDGDPAMLACVQDISEQRRRERALEELQQTTRELLAARTREDIAALAADAVERVLDTPYGTVWFRDDDGGFTPVATTDAAGRDGLPTVEDVDSMLADAARRADQQVVEVLSEGDTMESLGCVLVAQVGPDGLLSVGITDGAPSDADRRFVEILAANVAAALDSADREADLERTNEQLAILNRIVRHDIRNDVSLLMGELEQASRALETDATGTVTDHIDTALDDAEHIVELTDTVGDIVEVVSGDAVPERTSIDLVDMVEREVERARAAHPAGTFTVVIDDEPTVAADEMLSSVFRNLLNNAVDHHEADDPEVEVEVTADGDEAVVRVVDDGPGVPDERKEVIFGRGEQGLESSGVGLGLYLVDQLVTRFDGEVTVEDATTGGAAFVVRLPMTDG